MATVTRWGMVGVVVVGRGGYWGGLLVWMKSRELNPKPKGRTSPITVVTRVFEW